MYYGRENNFEYNECMGRGMCSINPRVTSFQEVMLILLRSITYYVLKLEKLGYECSEVKVVIINGISNLVTTTAYSDEQLLSIIICAYNSFIRLKREYKKICKDKNQRCIDIKIPLKLTPDSGLSDILNQGQYFIAGKNKYLSNSKKYSAELLILLIKSVSLSILKLADYSNFDYSAADLVLSSLNLFNGKTSVKNIGGAINRLADTDLKLWKIRKNSQINMFGNIGITEVSMSTDAGKAILVSGSNLMDLYSLLDSLKDESIDVYTHGDLLIAHIFEKFKQFKNLRGHFGSFNDNSVIDFATFPGAILLTKHATQNVEYLIRGRLFTTDEIAPKGVIKISANDYSEILNASKNAKGFSKGTKKEPVIVGFDTKTLSDEFHNLGKRVKTGEIKHIFVIGMANYSLSQAEYFHVLLKKIPKDSYVISLSYCCNRENFLYINIANNFPMQLTILDLLFKEVPSNSKNFVFYLTKCDSNTLSCMIGLKRMGAENIYLSDCSPTLVNPTVMNSFMKLYGINKMTLPHKDLDYILKKSLQ